MATIDDVKRKFANVVGGLEKKPRRLNAILGDGKGVVNVPNQTGSAYVRLEDGTFFGVVFNNRVPFDNNLPVVIGYSHEQPDRFQVLEARSTPSATAPGVPAQQIANVTGLAATWAQRDCRISWTALPTSSLFHNYRVTIDDVDYLPTTNSLLYTLTMNEDEHSGAFDTTLSIQVVAVDVYGGISQIPATLNTTWLSPVIPNVTGLAAAWSIQTDDCELIWTDITRPYNFSNYLLTIDGISRVVTTNHFLYSAGRNRIDHSGIYDPVLHVSLVAVNDLGTQSSTPATLDTTNPFPTGDTVRDSFDTYGGDTIAQSGSTALKWVSLMTMETGAPGETVQQDWPIVGGVVPQGVIGAQLDTDTSHNRRDGAMDFTNDGRFTTDDYFVAAAYVSNSLETFNSFFIRFTDNGGKHAGIVTPVEMEGGAYSFVAIKVSDIAADSGFNWANVSRIALYSEFYSFGVYPVIYMDDLRLVKADPGNTATFNDTGEAWDFSGGVWHIYNDLSNIPFALGQIKADSPGSRYVAMRAGSYAITNHIAAGIYLRTNNGTVGVVGFAIDANNCYEIKIDSSSDTLKLVKYVGGTPTELGSLSVATSPNVKYYLALERDINGYLNGYLATEGQTVISAATLKFHVLDSTYVSGKIGLSNYGCAARYFYVRAGSPEHALSAELAYDSNRLNGLHSTDFALIGHDHIGGDGAPIVEGALSFSDITTANASVSNHGLLPKLSGIPGQYLGGDGAFYDLPTTLSLFLDDTANGITGYKSLLLSVPAGGEVNVAASLSAADTVIEEFAAAAGTFEFISSQILHVHLHLAKTAGTKGAFAYAKLYRRASGGSETLIGTSTNTSALTGSSDPYDLDASVPDTTFAATDRLVVKIYGTPTGGGSTPTTAVYYQGITNSRVEIGTISTALDARYAVAAKGVTNGDTHDHNGGDGSQIDHVNVANKGANTHAQIDTHIAAIHVLESAARGTSFPGSPVDGQTFLRTDLALPCVYNGTASRWQAWNPRWIEEMELIDLVAGWEFGIRSGTTVYDMGRRVLNLTANGSPAYAKTDPRICYASFNGSSIYYSLATNDCVASTITFCGWVYVTIKAGFSGSVVASAGSASAIAWKLRTGGTSNQIWITANGSTEINGSSVSTNTWYLVFLAHNGTTVSLYTWRSSTEVIAINAQTLTVTTANTGQFRLGQSLDANPDYLNGRMVRPRMFNVALGSLVREYIALHEVPLMI